MPRASRVKRALNESTIQDALTAFSEGHFNSLSACGRRYSIPQPTLFYRLHGRNSRSTAHEKMQNLSPAEEDTLVQWITRLTRTGYPISPALTLEMAEEIRQSRVALSTTPLGYVTHISRRWLSRFYSQHPEIEGVYAQQIDNAEVECNKP